MNIEWMRQWFTTAPSASATHVVRWNDVSAEARSSAPMADAVAQWEAAREAAAAREVDRLLAELFPKEDDRG